MLDAYQYEMAINPLTLTLAKRDLTILEIFNLQIHFLENIWSRNVDRKPDKKFYFIQKIFSKV